MSNRCIMPRSSWSIIWQCATKQPTVIGLKYTRNVIDPGVARLMLLGGPGQVTVGSGGPTVVLGGRGWYPSWSPPCSLGSSLGLAGGAGSRDKQGIVPFGQRQ